MKKERVHVDPNDESTFPRGRVSKDRLDATTDEMIEEQARRDEDEAMHDMARYVRGIRRRVGMSQEEFSRSMGISVDTLRNWEQGRRHPTATARALLRVLNKSPEIALAALRE